MTALRACCRDVFVARLDSLRWLRGATSLLRGRPAVEGLFWSRPLRNAIRRWGRQKHFDAIVVYCSSMVQYLATADFGDSPVIVDLVDVDSQKFFDYAATARGLKRRLFRWEGGLLRRLEQEVSRRADAVVLVSESEAELFRRTCPNDRTYGVTNGVDLNYFEPANGEGTPGRCVFVGALDYRANVDGLLWFCRHVWPRVRERNQGATFAVVGRNPGSEVRKLDNIDGIEIVGTTPDVRPHIADASLAIVPLRIARGIQNKVLEAMAMRRAVVASPQALEGICVVPGKHVAEAESPDQWVHKILRLLDDQQQRHTLGDAGRAFVESHHDWNTCLSPLGALLDANFQDSGRSATALDRASNAPNEAPNEMVSQLP